MPFRHQTQTALHILAEDSTRHVHSPVGPHPEIFRIVQSCDHGFRVAFGPFFDQDVPQLTDRQLGGAPAGGHEAVVHVSRRDFSPTRGDHAQGSRIVLGESSQRVTPLDIERLRSNFVAKGEPSMTGAEMRDRRGRGGWSNPAAVAAGVARGWTEARLQRTGQRRSPGRRLRRSPGT